MQQAKCGIYKRSHICTFETTSTQSLRSTRLLYPFEKPSGAPFCLQLAPLCYHYRNSDWSQQQYRMFQVKEAKQRAVSDSTHQISSDKLSPLFHNAYSLESCSMRWSALRLKSFNNCFDQHNFIYFILIQSSPRRKNNHRLLLYTRVIRKVMRLIL